MKINYILILIITASVCSCCTSSQRIGKTNWLYCRYITIEHIGDSDRPDYPFMFSTSTFLRDNNEHTKRCSWNNAILDNRQFSEFEQALRTFEKTLSLDSTFESTLKLDSASFGNQYMSTHGTFQVIVQDSGKVACSTIYRIENARKLLPFVSSRINQLRTEPSNVEVLKRINLYLNINIKRIK